MHSVEENKPLLEVIVDSNQEIDWALRDNHFHFDVKREIPKITHLEILECIEILKKARKNLSSYKTMKKTQGLMQGMVHAANLVYIAGIPAASLITVLGIVGDLTPIQNALLAPFLSLLSLANKAYDDFMQVYNDAINKLKDCENCDFSSCINNIFPDGTKGTWEFCRECVDSFSCPYKNEKQILDNICDIVYHYYYWEPCGRDAKGDLCEKAKETLTCCDQIKERLIHDYIIQHADEKSMLESNISNIEKEIEIIKMENPNYDMTSIIIFAVTAGISLSVTLYLLVSYLCAKADYEKPHPIHEVLKPERLNRIINITSKLDIPVKDKSIERLIEKLESKKYDHAFTFFSTIKKAFPHENEKKVVNTICEKAYQAGLISF